MENNLNDRFSFERGLEKKHKEESELKRRLEAIRTETYSKIKDNPEVMAFLEPYNSIFYDSFLHSYASGKSLWVGFSDKYKEDLANNEIRLLDIGRNALACLMKKKLVDLRREWGAGSLDLPGINTAFDFLLLSDKVFEVDWIPAIEEEEIETLLAYVEQHKGYDLGFQFEYDSTKFQLPLQVSEGMLYLGSESFFTYHDTNTSAGNLKVLPDTRGEKAYGYIKAYHRKKKEERDAKIASGELPADKEFDLKPPPPSGKVSFMIEFIKRCDDATTLQHYKTYLEYHSKTDDEDEESLDDKVKNILAHLHQEKVVLPIKSNEDWRVAFIESWETYRKQSVAQGIRKAFEDYQFHVEMGIAFQSLETSEDTLKKVEDLKEKFLEGREIMGEPRDFNF